LSTLPSYSPCPSFYSTLPRPPTSTLFPYTTLFRSHGHDKVYVLSRSGEMPSVRGTDYEFTPQHFTLDNAFKYLENGLIPLDKLLELFKAEMLEHDVDMTLFERKTDQPEIDKEYDLEHLEDRKSTRLNYSHVSISYA